MPLYGTPDNNTSTAVMATIKNTFSIMMVEMCADEVTQVDSDNSRKGRKRWLRSVQLWANYGDNGDSQKAFCLVVLKMGN
ncbi:hypothetical protein LSH36_145g03009 [Paralvinella palmiformis]|uniref:Uncharacterized protein n=1 Tax=Paralvinella palmiformis TaxID=53620 RepID=A0AAD9JVL0_9ANNE|nr:hypothetical protein LSH36_145g03009 [Paralvinella palmiformis]